MAGAGVHAAQLVFVVLLLLVTGFGAVEPASESRIRSCSTSSASPSLWSPASRDIH